MLKVSVFHIMILNLVFGMGAGGWFRKVMRPVHPSALWLFMMGRNDCRRLLRLGMNRPGQWLVNNHRRETISIRNRLCDPAR